MARTGTGSTGLPGWALPLATFALSVPMPAHSQEVQVLSASEWQVYGTAYHRTRDADVPGGGTVRVDPRRVTDQPWSSGATLPVPGALAAGERWTRCAGRGRNARWR